MTNAAEDEIHWTQRAKSRMRALGITQEGLMEALEVTTQGAVGHYLNKRRELSVTQAISLAKALECTMDELFLGSSATAGTKVREPSATYHAVPADADKLLDNYKRMSDDRRRSLLELSRQLAEQRPSARTDTTNNFKSKQSTRKGFEPFDAEEKQRVEK